MKNVEWVHKVFSSVEPVQLIYGLVAICGGVARYLSGFANGKRFSVAVFLASAFVAGFSGWMFALIGTSMSMPPSVTFIMAGSGGFFGEQTMKLVMEWAKGKTL